MTRDADLRRWLPLAGAVLVIASLVPPLSTLARRHLFAESIQFSVFAMVSPALIALGAARPAASRDRWPSFLRGVVFLIVFAGVSVAWRTPSALDALARLPGLVAAEALTLLVAGTGLWLELVRSPRLAPRLSGAQRAAIAALAVWSAWIAAYALGFSSQPLVHAYAEGSRLGIVADQEIAVGLVWGVAGACFVPVIFAGVVSWLRDSGDIGEEFRQAFPEAGARTGVRGWQRPPRRRSTRAG
jgi:cytochrome c oxidase assembly factor CtaG